MGIVLCPKMDVIMETKKIVLNIGSGCSSVKDRISYFKDWQEIRADTFPECDPDIISDIRTLDGVDDNSIDAIYASHVLEHCYWHEQPMIFNSFMRVLNSTGFAIIEVPDIDSIKDNLLETLYLAENRIPITSLDLLYGFRGAVDPKYNEKVNPGMMHKMGFNVQLIKDILSELKIKGVYRTHNHQITTIIWKDQQPEILSVM